MARNKHIRTRGRGPEHTPDREPSAPQTDMLLSRRDVMKAILGASAALSMGLGGCERKPERQIVSRIDGPEYQKPGKALYYSSTWTEGAFPYGLMIKAVDGRPIKVEGNPDHPVNRGSSDAAMQASTLSLYDPDRMRGAVDGGAPVTWAAVDKKVVAAVREAKRIALITRATLGPSERALVASFLKYAPGARHFVHETVHDMPRRRVWRRAFGEDGVLEPQFDKAKVILGFDADFLGNDCPSLSAIGAFASGRDVEGGASPLRFYAAEGGMTVTGANADYRIRLRPSKMAYLAGALRAAVEGDNSRLQQFSKDNQLDTELLGRLVTDLKASGNQSLIVAGDHLPESVHTQVTLLNHALGAFEHTLLWNPFPPGLPVSSPAEIADYFKQGVDVAILLDVNPVYDWPGGNFDTLLAKARLSVAHGLTPNETLARANLALASCHNLESWNDARPRFGVDTLCQPVIAPLFDSRQPIESLLRWTQPLLPDEDPVKKIEDWHTYVKNRWTAPLLTGEVLAPPATDNLPLAVERGWESALRVGGRFLESGTRWPMPPFDRQALVAAPQKVQKSGDFELVLQPHHAVFDGRFANNAWLQELPDPVAKLVWDNAAMMSPRTARTLGVAEGDMVAVAVGGKTVKLPTLIEPGVADRLLVATLGHGRTEGGVVAKLAAGTNLALLLGAETADAPRLIADAAVTKAGGLQKLVRVQGDFSMHDRPIVLDGTLDEYRRDPGFVAHKRHLPEPSEMYDEIAYETYKWGMSIDLNRCVGCGACITACQAENNVPVVGRDECANGRKMHWIRIERYLAGDMENPTVHNQPMMCQQCDHAPCENVCPVNATTHSMEGLNQMAYNRCVGTRYCSNNCPYKARRFNFYRYQERQLREEVQELVFNPDVTVRSVGVMEKCTFCVQRINAAKFDAKNRGETLKDGAVVTACQQACPAGAIRFGDVNLKNGRVTKDRKNPRAYSVLEELNTRPNVSYLARIRNRDAESNADDPSEGGHH